MAALRAVVLRAVVFRAVLLRAVAFFAVRFRAVAFLAVLLRVAFLAVLFRAPAFLAVLFRVASCGALPCAGLLGRALPWPPFLAVLFACAVAFLAVLFRAVAFLAVLFRAPAFLAGALRAVAFLAVVRLAGALRAVVFLAVAFLAVALRAVVFLARGLTTSCLLGCCQCGLALGLLRPGLSRGLVHYRSGVCSTRHPVGPCRSRGRVPRDRDSSAGAAADVGHWPDLTEAGQREVDASARRFDRLDDERSHLAALEHLRAHCAVPGLAMLLERDVAAHVAHLDVRAVTGELDDLAFDWCCREMIGDEVMNGS